MASSSQRIHFTRLIHKKQMRRGPHLQPTRLDRRPLSARIPSLLIGGIGRTRHHRQLRIHGHHATQGQTSGGPQRLQGSDL